MPVFKILCNFHVENLRKTTENLIHDKQFSRVCTGNKQSSILSAQIFTVSSCCIQSPQY